MPKQKDYSGHVITKGETLDLGGKTIVVTRAIVCAGKIKNGTIDGTRLPQHDAGVIIPFGSDGARIDDLTFKGGSYNGLAKVFGNGARITDWKVLPGSGWAIQILGSHRGYIRAGSTLNLRRGGIYFGSGEKHGFGNDFNCDDWIIENVTLDGADEEAVFRCNTTRRLIVRKSWFDNTRSKSGKEAVQNRGVDARFEDCTILGSTSNGQTPNGVPHLVTGYFNRCTIYGYNSVEAGGDIDFEECTLVNRPTFKHNEKTYTLKTPGNQMVVNPQSAARGLPAGHAFMTDCIVDAKEVTRVPKRVSQTNTTFRGGRG